MPDRRRIRNTPSLTGLELDISHRAEAKKSGLSLKTPLHVITKSAPGKSDRRSTSTPSGVSPSRMAEKGSSATETLCKPVTWLARLSPSTVSVLTMEPSLISVCVTWQNSAPQLARQGLRVGLRIL